MITRYCFFIVLFIGCNSPANKDHSPTAISNGRQDSLPISQISKNATKTTKVISTHLHDTIVIQGEFVLFLRPDSLRFEWYENEDGNIYDADSDFGYAISATMDSISKNRKYITIKAAVSDKRYILIRNCKTCPQTIDRDTIDYAVLLTSKEKELKINTNLHSGDYLDDVDEYFNIRKR